MVETLDLFPADESPSGQEPVGDSGSVVKVSRVSIDVNRFIQPKTVTYADYQFSNVQYQVFVHIREELSAYVSRNLESINPKELVRVPLFCSHYPRFHGSPSKFHGFLMDMLKAEKGNLVSFSWRFDGSKHAGLYRWMMMHQAGKGGRLALPKDGTVFSQTGVIIVNVLHSTDNPDLFYVDVNPMLFPFLLYYGAGNGGTFIERDVALRLRSSYSQRLYELIMDWVTSSDTKVFSFDELRSYLHFPESYKSKEIRRRVLEVAREELEAAGADVGFTYEFRYDSNYGFASGAVGPVRSNCVVLSLFRREYTSGFELARQRLLLLFRDVADREKALDCAPLAERAVRAGKEPFLMSKFEFYGAMLRQGKIKGPQYKNVMLKIIRDTLGADLRSDAHIRNSRTARRREEQTGGEPRLLFG